MTTRAGSSTTGQPGAASRPLDVARSGSPCASRQDKEAKVMKNREQRPDSRPQAGSGRVAQDPIDTEMPPRGTARSVTEARPTWLDQFVWSVLWKIVTVSLATVLMLLLARELRHLLWLLVVSSFFAIAMIPGVEQLHRRWARSRGAAVAVIYLSVVAFVVLMVLVLIPALEEFANQVRANGSGWIHQLNDLSRQWLGRDLVGEEAGDRAAIVTQASLRDWSGSILGLASSGIGILFDVTVVAMFAFYLAADYPRIQRAVLSRLRPDRQQVYGWVTEISIRQTGSYLYSRLLLTLINASLGFCVMLILRLPLAFALPLAVFMGFFSEFIPAIGTYIGAAIPILTVLAVQGPEEAVVLLVWVLLYQWIENTLLSPRLSAKTMKLNGAVAFGAALAGGAVAGPMGAFMALPFAALLTAVAKNSGKRYKVVYQSPHGDDAEPSTTKQT
jgi:predicted PurR-regulated permease PerM